MGSAAIPIQSPQIRPDVVSGGQNTGLEPLIQALQFYKKSKLDEQRNQIDAVRAGSDANLQGAQADTLRANLKQRSDAQDAWDKTVSTAPAPLQPFLKMLNGLQALDPELQRVAAPILAKNIPGFADNDPNALTRMASFLHLGLPLEVSAHLSGVKVRDIADQHPADPTAIPLPKSFLNWKYTPPNVAGSDLSRQLRAQGQVVSQANKDDQVVQRDLTKARQQIATDAWKTANPNAPAPLVPVQFDPNDPNQVLALHKYVAQHHYDTRLQLNASSRAAAEQRIQATAGTAAQSNPAADQLQQVIDLMSQKPDTIPQ